MWFPALVSCPSFRLKEEFSGPISASGEALDILNYLRQLDVAIKLVLVI